MPASLGITSPMAASLTHKILLLTYRFLHCLAPGYLSDLHPCIHTLTRITWPTPAPGYEPFVSLPPHSGTVCHYIYNICSLVSFKKYVKSYLFSEAFGLYLSLIIIIIHYTHFQQQHLTSLVCSYPEIGVTVLEWSECFVECEQRRNMNPVLKFAPGFYMFFLFFFSLFCPTAYTSVEMS